MSKYDKDLQDAGLCGHICDNEGGPFHTFHCTKAADHILDGEPLHQAIQLSGPVAGRINGEWMQDGTPTMEPIDMTPVEVCALDQPLDPAVREKVRARLAVINAKVNELALEYHAQATADAEQDLLKNCTSLFASFTEQAADEHEALQLACELLAVVVRKLAGADQIPA